MAGHAFTSFSDHPIAPLQLPILMNLLAICLAVTYGLIALALTRGIVRNEIGSFSNAPSVSVLVAARNAAVHLDVLLEALADQTYEGNLGIYVLDDRSTDGTAAVAAKWSDRIQGLRIIPVDRAYHRCGKKNALEHGIRASDGDIVLTTDADCRPLPEWIARTVSYFDTHTGAVAGPAPLEGRGWARGLAAFQSLVVGAIGLGSAGLGYPLTCSGRNFGFRRAAFTDVGGYDSSGHLIGGDDVYLMRAIAVHRDWDVVYHDDTEAAVPSPAHSDALWQRHLRYQSKTLRYGFGTLMVSLPVYILHLTLLVAPLIVWWRPDQLPVLLGLAAFKFLTDGVFLYAAARRLRQIGLLLWLPIVELISIPYVAVVSAIGAVRPTSWS